MFIEKDINGMEEWVNGKLFCGQGRGLSGCGNLRKYNFDHPNLFQT